MLQLFYLEVAYVAMATHPNVPSAPLYNPLIS
jgi:hypothetical protein